MVLFVEVQFKLLINAIELLYILSKKIDILNVSRIVIFYCNLIELGTITYMKINL